MKKLRDRWKHLISKKDIDEDDNLEEDDELDEDDNLEEDDELEEDEIEPDGDAGWKDDDGDEEPEGDREADETELEYNDETVWAGDEIEDDEADGETEKEENEADNRIADDDEDGKIEDDETGKEADDENAEASEADDEDGDTDEELGDGEDNEAEEIEEDDSEEEECDEIEEDSSEDWHEDGRRVYRHKRRIRNQIIAYGAVVICLAALISAGIAAGSRVSAFIKDKRLAKQQEEQMAEKEAQEEQQPEEIVIAAPPDIEEEIEESVDTMDEQLEDFISSCILSMPLEDKIAGLFIITPEALTGVRTVVQAGEGTQEALSEYAVGGLVYFSNNILNQEQLTGMLSNTVSMSKYPIFLAVDEEGGAVSRVANSNISVSKVEDMAVIGAGGDAAGARLAGMTIGSYLKEIGFNLDFAPVADLAGAGSKALGNRSFGTDPAVTAEMVTGVVDGLQSNDVSACLKHFPGIGDTQEDTHEGRVETTKTLEEMRKSDFIPFQEGIKGGVDFIMVSHVTASAVDTEGMPSSLSRIMITDILREELGYDGVVITDALNMDAITAYYTSSEAAVNAIKAGADMLLMPEDFESAYRGLLSAVQDGTVTEERIDESLRRIYRIKYADKLR